MNAEVQSLRSEEDSRQGGQAENRLAICPLKFLYRLMEVNDTIAVKIDRRGDSLTPPTTVLGQ